MNTQTHNTHTENSASLCLSAFHIILHLILTTTPWCRCYKELYSTIEENEAERRQHLPKVTQLARAEPGFPPRSCGSKAPGLNYQPGYTGSKSVLCALTLRRERKEWGSHTAQPSVLPLMGEVTEGRLLFINLKLEQCLLIFPRLTHIPYW